jgi:hypothetical protein
MGWTDDGFLGISWLSMKEAFGISFFALITGLAILAFSYSSGEVDPYTVGTVEEGTEYYENYFEEESCTKMGGRRTCDTYYVYECTADVNYTYSVNGVSYQGRDFVLVTSNPSSQGGCLEDVESTLLPIGISVNVYYQEDDHSKSTLVDRSIDPVIWTFCCGVCGGILLLTSILISIKNNNPKPELAQSTEGNYW